MRRWLLALTLAGIVAMAAYGDSYRDTVRRIVADTGDGIGRGDLLYSTQMQMLYCSIDQYEDEATELAMDDNATSDERLVAVLTLQRIPLNRYLGIVEELARKPSTETNRRVLGAAIFPGHGWSARLILEFARPAVRRSLARVQASPLADPPLVASIEELLSGSLAEYAREEKEKPLWHCQ